MENISTWTPVVAAALSRSDGRWLMQRRAAGKHHAGLWEFPGGKVEDGEVPVNALVRELMEELLFSPPAGSLIPCSFAQETGAVGRPPIVLMLYTCTLRDADIDRIAAQGEGGETGWFHVPDIQQLPKPPLDSELARRLWMAPGK